MSFEHLLDGLNEYQLAAVTDTSKACLVNAQVGSGKTTVLTTKVIYLHEKSGISYKDMIVLTFTNKAANEVKDRIRKYDNTINSEEMCYFGTFHSVALRLLKNELDLSKVGYTHNFSVMEPAEEVAMAVRIISEKSLNIKYQNKLSDRIEKAHRGIYRYSSMKNDDDIKKLVELLEVEKKKSSKMDFDDLIKYTRQLLPESVFCPKWIIVDEFQDTNDEQMKFISELSKNGNIFVVGDPNQIIYSWRGTNGELFKNFCRDYSAKELTLPINYRSCSNILEAAKIFLENDSELSGVREAGQKIVVKSHYNAFNEAQYLVDRIRELADSGIAYKDIAVFYRFQKQSKSLEDSFSRANIPYEVSLHKSLKDIPVIKWFLSVLQFAINNNDIDKALSAMGDNTYGERGLSADHKKLVLNKEQTESVLLSKMLSFKTWCSSNNDYNIIYSYFDLDKYLNPILSTYESDRQYIITLLKNIYDYSLSIGKGLLEGIDDFINSSALYGSEIFDKSVDKSADSVKLMTLHSAKGLEFKYVYIIGTNDGIIPMGSYNEEDRKEERRLFFVGLTRAKEYIELSYYTNPDDVKVQAGPSQYIKLIPANLIEQEEKSTVHGMTDIHNIGRSIMSKRLSGTSNNGDNSESTTAVSIKKAKHAKYGLGKVVSETDDLITVDFEGYGEKSFIKAFSEIEIVSDGKEKEEISDSQHQHRNAPDFEYTHKKQDSLDVARFNDNLSFQPGDVVIHPKANWGRGVVLKVTPLGNDTLLEIAFESCGTKRITANGAKLKKQNSENTYMDQVDCESSKSMAYNKNVSSEPCDKHYLNKSDSLSHNGFLIYQHYCGKGVHWSLDNNGTLTIGGRGKMEDYGYLDGTLPTPWEKYDIKKIVIEPGITHIGNCAFNEKTNITSVIITDTVVSIGEAAFYQCSKIVEIYLPKSVRTINRGAFYECESLSNVKVEEGLVSIGEEAFYGCKKLINITIPDSLTNIGEYAFEFCQSLESIYIPDTVCKIGDGAFSYCSNLEMMSLPKNITSIEEGVFSDCSRLKVVSIPNGVTKISDNAFSDCRSLTEIIIPDSVLSIGENAFHQCFRLTNIVFSENLREIGEDAFEDTIWLRKQKEACEYVIVNGILIDGNNVKGNIVIPNGVFRICLSAFFYSREKIRSVVIPQSVSYIADHSFGYEEDFENGGFIKKNDFTIFCYSNTAGEKYAIENGFEYILMDSSFLEHTF